MVAEDVPRRIAIIASASGNGKTTLGRELARRLDVEFLELDALVHGPGWAELEDAALRARVAPVVAREGWVIDGSYERKLGRLVLGSAELVVWLDLPMRVWMPRLARRTWRRWRGREELWNGNRETIRGALWGRESLFVYAVRMHHAKRRRYPRELAELPVLRLTSRDGVTEFLRGIPRGGQPSSRSGR